MKTAYTFASLLGLALALPAASCFNPVYSTSPPDVDAGTTGMAFRCHPSDSPACPSGFACCLDGKCGEELPPNAEGWCIPPPAPVDMVVTPFQFWDFGAKGMYFTGELQEIPMTGVDPVSGEWRCKRDDQNPDPPASIKRMFEPNDLPEQAVTLTSPLPIDPMPGNGSNYEICPDKSAPDAPDVDVYKFKLSSPLKVIAEIKYRVINGDLDLGLFKEVVNPDTMQKQPVKVLADLTAVDNGCIEANNLQPGTYYVVVRGTPKTSDMTKYTMNTYSIRVFGVQMSGYSCSPKKDGG